MSPGHPPAARDGWDRTEEGAGSIQELTVEQRRAGVIALYF